MRAVLYFGFIASMVPSFLYAEDWKVSLRDEPKEPTKKESGAKFLYTNQDNGDSSYKIDSAINISKNERGHGQLFKHNVALAISRNTQIDEEVDTQTISYTYGYQLSTNSNNVYHMIPVSIAYKVDDIKEAESVVASVAYYPEIQLANKKSMLNLGKEIFLGQYEEGGPKPTRISWQPHVGVSHEDIIKSEELEAGEVTRLNVGANIYINLTKDRIAKKSNNRETYVETLLLSISYQYWRDLDKDDNAFGPDDTHIMRVYSISYPLDIEGNIRLYASHFDGEDPIKGKPEQEYLEVGVEFKIDI